MTTRPRAAPGSERPLNGVARPHAPKPIYYPESDGKPLGETGLHVVETFRLFSILNERYAGDPNVYVGSDLLIYYEEGNPRTSGRLSPDVFVIRGVPKLPLRRIYKLWEEKVPPCLALEITSRKTRRRDLRVKPDLYAGMGVREYVLYDPEADYLKPPLQGLQLVNGAYQPMPAAEGGALLSDQLGLRLILVNGRLQLFDRTTGEMLLSPEDRATAESAARRAAEERAAAAEARAAELEARLRAIEGQRQE